MDKQRTPEWHAQRVLRVTGSRAGAILGMSPWLTADDVLRAMVREYHGAPSEFEDNPAVQFGRNHEKRAMLAFMRESGLNVEECGFYPVLDWLGSSPDGITSDGGVLEMKVPFSCRDGRDFKPLSEQPHYYSQVQIEMFAAAVLHGYFVQYTPPADGVGEHINIERVEFDDEWMAENIPKLKAFHARVLAELDNPAHLEPLRATIITTEAQALLDRIDAAHGAKKAAEDAEKAALAELVTLAGNRDADVCGRKLTLVKREGAISYAKALAELAPGANLEKWRGKGSESWRLT